MCVATRDCWFLTGPTASGKSNVAIELAKLLDAEIVSMDSMAVYHGMDVGTAKPTASQRAATPHHLIDVVSPQQDFSLAQYVELAERAVADVRAGGRQPLFVGGTPLYLKALLRGIFTGPPADWPLRRALAQVAKEQGADALHERLRKVDPVSAMRLHASDQRRIIRALEVFEKTGQPISVLQQQFDRRRSAQECRVFVLDWPRSELAERIDRRVEAMFAAGLVAEVERLLASGPLGRTARAAVGYREVIEHLEGLRDLSATVELVKLHTRQFAKRQSTWFRSLSECRRIDVTEPLDARGVSERIVALGQS